MNSEINKFIGQLSKPLRKREIVDFSDYVRDIMDQILRSELSKKNKRILIGTLNEERKKIDIEEDINTKLVSAIQKVYAPCEGIEGQKIIQHNITQDDWEKLEGEGIQALGDDFAYRGGKARHSARVLLGYDINEADKKYSDVDGYTTQEDVQGVCEKYRAGADGVKHVSSFTTDIFAKEMALADFAMNQIAVTKDMLYITQGAKEELQSGKVRIIRQGDSLYGEHSFQKDGETVFTSLMLYRAIRFLIYGKIQTLKIAQHNISQENLKHLNINAYLQVLINKILSESDEEKQQDLFINLRNILIRLKFLGTDANFFKYLQKIVNPNALWGIDSENEMSLIDETNWIVDKHIKAIKRGLSESIHDGYKITSKEIVDLTLDSKKTVDIKDFQKNMEKFKVYCQSNRK